MLYVCTPIYYNLSRRHLAGLSVLGAQQPGLVWQADPPMEVHPEAPKPSEPSVEVVPSHKGNPDGRPSGKPSGKVEVAAKPAPSKRVLSSPGPEPPATRPKPTQSLPSLPSYATAKPKPENVPPTPTEADVCRTVSPIDQPHAPKHKPPPDV